MPFTRTTGLGGKPHGSWPQPTHLRGGLQLINHLCTRYHAVKMLEVRHLDVLGVICYLDVLGVIECEPSNRTFVSWSENSNIWSY
jgi:hypothetical protein